MIGEENKGKTLYVIGEYPDWEWEESGDKKTQSTYQGEVKDGEPNGLGVLFQLMDGSILGVGGMGEYGAEQSMTITGTLYSGG